MNKVPSMCPDSNNQTFRLYKINEIKDYFIAKIRERELMSKGLMLFRSKLSSINRTISKALIDNEISHEDFTTIIDEERNYCELKESIRIMESQRSNIERNKLIEDGKGIGFVKLSDKMKELIIILSLKYKAMLSFLFKL